jgi:hypothetical protein
MCLTNLNFILSFKLNYPQSILKTPPKKEGFLKNLTNLEL